jgi:hypothetical protein
MKAIAPITASVLLAAGIFGISTANAASVSYFLNQSNNLADGTNYLKVTISDGTGGLIDFKIETLSSLNSIAGSNFGMQLFDFNTALATLPPDSAIVNLPSGWNGNVKPPTNPADGFGKFEFDVSDGGNNRLSVLTFSLNVAGDSINDYYDLSSGSAIQGNVQFAAKVVGFTTQSCTSGPCTGAFFGGGTAVPLPAAIWLFGSGMMGIAALARKNPG